MAAITVEQALQLALSQYRAGRFAQAESDCLHILAQRPGHPAALHQLGLVYLATGNRQLALEFVRKAVVANPAVPASHCDLGTIHRLLGQLDAAVACYRRALAISADLPEAHLNLGEALLALGKFDEAIASFGQAVKINPGDAEAHNNLGNALRKRGQTGEAIECFQRALEIKPGYPEAHYNLGSLYSDTARWEEAIEDLRRAIALRPDFADAHLNLALVLLRRGCFEEGWKEYEWRWQSSSHSTPQRAFSSPRWTGTPAPGEAILVHAEQGFGDFIHFLRYLPFVRDGALASRVICECPPQLLRLLQQTDNWNAEIVVHDTPDSAALPPFDRHVPLASLPLVLGKFAPSSMPCPYLRADAASRAPWRGRFGRDSRLRVGLAWAGNPRHRGDHRRSIRFDALSPILRVPTVTFYKLQFGGEGPPEIDRSQAPISDVSEHIHDFADASPLISELDLVITVDTATAHLAGALGRPVWTLLAFIPDWRWGLEREDTPWYPTMRLFRQKTAGDWDEVIQRVAEELRIVSSEKTGKCRML